MALNPLKRSSSKDDDSEEGITVAIRMRPLNSSEESRKRIWKVLPKYSSIAQTTREGKPLAERITGRTFFTFDKTFGEGTNNTQVYNGVAKGIVNSVVDGLNGTIFAYGQTSSGKTYTMQGAGNLEQGMGGEGGIVHLAATDIFSQISRQQDRNFLVRVSFLEIYNEEVRDLLGDTSKTIKIREDPRQGVFVQSQEEIVTNFDDLLKVLVHGDKSRTFASTGMNERSSRSHTILKITIESREKSYDEDQGDSDNEFDTESEKSDPSSDGAIRISTLNLVDLAGSESVRHTGATGDRQKEGGLINQSLLTLSRVIVALGSPNQMHINFRDSKLTRILQPSLSGNARMAVICCATPSELYLEETRSTLQFASRAKLVKTNAQVNEVLDERSMIKRLQKELAEARRNQHGPGQGQVRDLEAQVATAGTQAMEAKKKLDRLKASILNSGYNIIDQGPVLEADTTKKRRKSDGPLLNGLRSPSKTDEPQIKSPNTAPRRKKTKVLQHQMLDIKQELKLVQEALSTRNIFVRDLNQTLSKCSEEIKKKNSQVDRMAAENDSLNEDNKKSHADITSLQEMVASLKESLDSSVKESESALAEKDSTIMESFEKLQQTLRENEDSQKDNEDLIARLSEVEKEKSELEQRISSLEENSRKEKEDLESSIAKISKEKDEAEVALENANTLLDDTSKKLQVQKVAKEEEIKNLSNQQKSRDAANIEALQIIATLRAEKTSLETTVSSLQEEAANSKEAAEDVEKELGILRVSNALAMQNNETSLQSYQSQIAEAEQKLAEEKEAKAQLAETLSKTQQENESLESRLTENEEKLQSEISLKSSLEVSLSETQKLVEETHSSEEMLKQSLKNLSDEKIQLENDLRQSVEAGEEKDQKLQTLLGEHEVALAEKNSMEAVVASHQQKAIEMERQMASAEEQISRVQSLYESMSAEKENMSVALESTKQKLEETLSEMSTLKEEASQKLQSIAGESATKDLTVRQLQEQVNVCHAEIQGLQNSMAVANSKFVEQEAGFTKLVEEKKALEENLQEIEDINTAKISMLEERHVKQEEEVQELELQLEQSKTQIQDLQNELDDKNSKLVEHDTNFNKLVEEKKVLDERLQEVEDINAAEVTTLTSEKEALETTIQEMEDISSARESTLNELHAAIQEMEDISAMKDLNMERLSTEKQEAIKELEQRVNEYNEKIKFLETTIESGNIVKDSIVEQLESEKEKLQKDLDARNSQIEELEKSTIDMKGQMEGLSSKIEIQSSEIESLMVNVMEVTSEKQEFESSFVELKNSCESLATENEAMHAKVSEIDDRNTEIELELEALKIEHRLLLERNSTLEASEQLHAEREHALAEYEEENTALSQQIHTVFTEATAFKERNDELQSTCENLQSQLEGKDSELLGLQDEVSNMTSSCKEMAEKLRDCETERDEAKNEMENLVRRVHDREAERDEATLELKRLYDENRDLNERINNSVPKIEEEQMREKVSELTNQNLELTHLLASVNESEERLRNAVKVAENNVVIKTSELEDANYRISQIEQELSELQSAGVEISQIEESKADLVKAIESIQKEKEDVEKSLQEEKDARTKLQQQMGDEQRALIQEGESMMAELRRKLEDAEMKFKESEAEAYTARQHVDEINDERNRLEEKYLEASAQLNSSDSSKERQEARITELESELNSAKSESYALKENIIDMKEKMRRSTRDSEKAIRESEIANSELSTIRRKLSSLENLNETQQMENSKLKKKIKQAEESNNLVATLREDLRNKENEIGAAAEEISALKFELEKKPRTTRSSTNELVATLREDLRNKENEIGAAAEEISALKLELEKKPRALRSLTRNDDEIQTMKKEMEELKELIKQKDKRIKKLEAVRLTKDRLATISKMKADNAKYEKKCSKMEKEISRLQDKISSQGSEADMTSEISELRFDKEALERKLRKFAAHCQRLEDDKAGIADALRSCNVDLEAHGRDVTEAIIHLCDKFTSTEEALEKQRSNPSFEKEKQSFERKIHNLTETLNQYEHEKSNLEAQLENAMKETSFGESEEHREKLRFLEQENLQLMQDVKSTKRQLQAAREEVVTLRMNVDQGSTADFGGLDVRTSAKDTISSLASSSQENSDTMELANLAEACSKHDTGTVLRRSTRNKKRNVLSDNTNGTRNEERRKRKSDKRQKVNALFETKHAINPTGDARPSDSSSLDIENKKHLMNQMRTPGLGETSSLGSEETGECKQS